MKIIEFNNNNLVTPKIILKEFSGDIEDIKFFLGLGVNTDGELEIAYSDENAATIIGYLEAAKMKVLKLLIGN